mgnify:CR=1 FL=1
MADAAPTAESLGAPDASEVKEEPKAPVTSDSSSEMPEPEALARVAAALGDDALGGVVRSVDVHIGHVPHQLVAPARTCNQ